MTLHHPQACRAQARAGLPRFFLAAALLLLIDGTSAAPVAAARGAADGTAGELQARTYFEQHRSEFATAAPVTTPAQTAAAQAEGALEGQRSTQPRPPGAAPVSK